jgi:hypothetical protein
MPRGEPEWILLNAKDFPVLRSGVALIDTLGRFRHNKVCFSDRKTPDERFRTQI